MYWKCSLLASCNSAKRWLTAAIHLSRSRQWHVIVFVDFTSQSTHSTIHMHTLCPIAARAAKCRRLFRHFVYAYRQLFTFSTIEIFSMDPRGPHWFLLGYNWRRRRRIEVDWSTLEIFRSLLLVRGASMRRYLLLRSVNKHSSASTFIHSFDGRFYSLGILLITIYSLLWLSCAELYLFVRRTKLQAHTSYPDGRRLAPLGIGHNRFSTTFIM